MVREQLPGAGKRGWSEAGTAVFRARSFPLTHLPLEPMGELPDGCLLGMLPLTQPHSQQWDSIPQRASGDTRVPLFNHRHVQCSSQRGSILLPSGQRKLVGKGEFWGWIPGWIPRALLAAGNRSLSLLSPVFQWENHPATEPGGK